MWEMEDIVALNPADSKQEDSFLSRLLGMAATTEAQLIEFSSLLESRDGPYVAAFGQLPFDLGLGSLKLQAPGVTPHSVIELIVRPATVTFDPLGRPQRDIHDTQLSERPISTITQVVGLVRLGVERARVHRIFVSRLENIRMLSDQLGDHKIESWMRLPQATLSEPVRRKPPLTGPDFQRDVAARARDHLAYATSALLHTYSVSTLVDRRDRNFLYGYHIMIAPGRLAGAGRPEPILNGLVASREVVRPSNTPLSDVFDLEKNRHRSDDPLIQRLQALNVLLTQGEPELALVGCVTALEWFLNQRFPMLATPKKNGEHWLAQLSTFLGTEHAALIEPADRDRLWILSKRRNAIAHGEPPKRSRRTTSDQLCEYTSGALFLALRVYRAINLATDTNEA